MSEVTYTQLGYHETPLRVQFGHIDGYGYLWHGHALSYFEIARADLVRPFSLSAGALVEAGLAVPMLDVSISYKNPAYDDEQLVVQSSLLKPSIALPELRFRYHVLRLDSGEEILRGWTKQLLIHKDGGVLIRLPKPIRDGIDAIWNYLDNRPRWSDKSP